MNKRQLYKAWMIGYNKDLNKSFLITYNQICDCLFF